MKIGVFDSGIGGKSVAEALQHAFVDDEIIYMNDAKNVPYGNKEPAEIRHLTATVIDRLVKGGCSIIVIACNTATTNAIDFLRNVHPRVFFVGLEPMVKPAAALTRTGVFAVCATRATLASQPYTTLKQAWAKGRKIIEPDCSEWATQIERGDSDTIAVEVLVDELTAQKCDVIVLACTHYHWLKKRFEAANPDIIILEPTDAIMQRISHFKQDYKSFTAAIN